MATIKPTVDNYAGPGDGSIVKVTWGPYTEADTCTPWAGPQFADKTFQMIGTAGGSSTAVHGSLDGGTTFGPLDDPGGTAIALTVAGRCKTVLQGVEQIKPVTTGGASQSITVICLARLSNPLRT